jgi:hypothetical protein
MNHLDGRSTVTKGRGPIVLRIQNGYSFYEHGTIAEAKAEAARLAERLGGEFVVLAPVAIVKPAPKTVTEEIVIPDLRLSERDDDGYPF